MKRIHEFTLLETVAFVIVLCLLAGIVIPMFAQQKRQQRAWYGSAHGAGIHSGMVLYAQGNNDYYPGFNSQGKPASTSITAGPTIYGTETEDGTSVMFRLTLVLRGNYVSPHYLVSPAEIDPLIVPAEVGRNLLPGQNYSYAMLNISHLEAARTKEWKATNNSRAAIISDRNIGGPGSTNSNNTTQSIHTVVSEGWRGYVVYNDNHSVFETDDLIKTEYGEQGEVAMDGLFSDKEVTSKGIVGADAAMVFKDNVSYSGQTAK